MADSEELAMMRRLDEQYLKTPFYGSRRMAVALNANRKCMQRLMRVMGIEAIYPKPKLSQRNEDHRIYPYLLRNIAIIWPNQVWAGDITYVPMPQGWMYLTAVMDWHSRFVLSWRLSNTIDGMFCVEALNEALLNFGKPEIFNTDQGVQYTALAFTSRLESAGVAISMDGRGRWMDNVFVERLWRTVKYENIYLKAYATVPELQDGLADYFDFYCHRRIHQSLDYCTPAEVYRAAS
jgi:putative transposase